MTTEPDKLPEGHDTETCPTEHCNCADCIFVIGALGLPPCSDCWNGNGDGETCYYEAKTQ